MIDKQFELKMEKLKLNAEMTIEEREHLKWVQEQKAKVPDFFYSDIKIPEWRFIPSLDEILNQKKKIKTIEKEEIEEEKEP